MARELTRAKISLEHGLPSRTTGFQPATTWRRLGGDFSTNRSTTRPRAGASGGGGGGGASGARGAGGGGGAVAKLRNLSFREKEDWWGLLGALSRECGFTLTRVEERCTR